MPSVSVVLPTYNRAAQVGAAIETVRSQTFHDWELIVVDDGSSDGTADVLARCAGLDGRIRPVRQANAGPAAARNLGLRMATGEYVAFLDDDDRWLPAKLERQVRWMHERPELVFTYTKCAAERDGQQTETWPATPVRDHYKALFQCNFVPVLTVMARRADVAAVGGFDARLSHSEDYDLWLRLAARGPFQQIPDVLAVYRIHGANMSLDLVSQCRGRLALIRKVRPGRGLGVSRLDKRRRMALLRVSLGRMLRERGDMAGAAAAFFHAVATLPTVGLSLWDADVQNRRFTAPCRLLRPYGEALSSFHRSCWARLAGSAGRLPVGSMPTRQPAGRPARWRDLGRRCLADASDKLRARSSPHGECAARRLGIVTQEFFHADLNGFGGYGMTVKNITDWSNRPGRPWTADVLLTKKLGVGRVRRYHNADVLFQPVESAGVLGNVGNALRHGAAVDRRGIALLLTIEYYQRYERWLRLMPRTPVVIWIRDPRSEEEWARIATVRLEADAMGDSLRTATQRVRKSLHRLLAQSRRHGRPVRFVHQAECLVPRARRLYGLPALTSRLLANPIAPPAVTVAKAERPRVCVLGRLDAIKRPWIVCELAKRLPNLDFCLMGTIQQPEVMEPVLAAYRDVPNLRWLGHVDGPDKWRLLQTSWLAINTSVHEALPVSFLEALACETPVVSCVDPDGLVTRFGAYTGEVLGDGRDRGSLDRFEAAITALLEAPERREAMGRQARAYVREVHSFERFAQAVSGLLAEVNGTSP